MDVQMVTVNDSIENSGSLMIKITFILILADLNSILVLMNLVDGIYRLTELEIVFDKTTKRINKNRIVNLIIGFWKKTGKQEAKINK